MRPAGTRGPGPGRPGRRRVANVAPGVVGRMPSGLLTGSSGRSLGRSRWRLRSRRVRLRPELVTGWSRRSRGGRRSGSAHLRGRGLSPTVDCAGRGVAEPGPRWRGRGFRCPFGGRRRLVAWGRRRAGWRLDAGSLGGGRRGLRCRLLNGRLVAWIALDGRTRAGSRLAGGLGRSLRRRFVLGLRAAFATSLASRVGAIGPIPGRLGLATRRGSRALVRRHLTRGFGGFRAIWLETPGPVGGVGRLVHASSLVRPPDGRRAQPIGAGVLPRQPLSTTRDGPIPPAGFEG